MKILFHDKNIVICEKPIGFDSEHQMPQAIRESIGGDAFTVHRLDLNVGGVMVYARTKESAAYLSKMIQNGKIVKEYVAIVHGVPEKRGIWEDLLWKDLSKNKVFVVTRMRGGVKKAKLEYEVLWSKDGVSLVYIKLHTGRSHQIRVQFASRGFPLVGDHKYGSKDKETCPRLYSCKISFPYCEKNVAFESFPLWMQYE